jgi:hypothetical protein
VGESDFENVGAHVGCGDKSPLLPSSGDSRLSCTLREGAGRSSCALPHGSGGAARSGRRAPGSQSLTRGYHQSPKRLQKSIRTPASLRNRPGS